MPKYLVHLIFADKKHYLDFRLPELDALCDLELQSASPVYDRSSLDEDSPFVYIELPSDEVARRVASRCVLIKKIYSIWGSGSSIDALIESCKKYPVDLMDPFMDPSFCVRVQSFGKKISVSEQLTIIKRFGFIPWRGEVELKEPDLTFCVLCDYGPNKIAKHFYFGREVACGDRGLAWRFTLKERNFLGPTSADAELAFIMANMAQARPGMLILDPFVGTGGLLIPCSHFGAQTIGADIDIRTLRGKDSKRNIYSNFAQYSLPPPDLVRCDLSVNVWRRHSGGIFDAIVCDPPYGIRAGARKSGTAKPVKKIPVERLADHIPRTQIYPVEEIMVDLLQFAAQWLKINARLCYLLPTTILYKPEDVPQHPAMELVSNCEQYLGGIFRRRLITMKKVREFEDGMQPTVPILPAHQEIRQKVMELSLEKPQNDGIKESRAVVHTRITPCTRMMALLRERYIMVPCWDSDTFTSNL